MEEIHYRLDRNRAIATLEIDTAGAVNTVGDRFVEELAAAALRARKDAVKGVILRSAKKRSFVDGANLLEIRSDPSPVKLELMLRSYHQALEALASGPFPVAAVLVEQTALGGGFELLLWACDRVFATAGCKMGLPEVTVGLFPAAGGLQTLQRWVGFESALDIVMGGRVLPAEFYSRSGPVQIAEPRQVIAAAERWIEGNPQLGARDLDSDPLPAAELDKRRKLIGKARQVYTACPRRPWFEAALKAAEEGLQLSFRQAVDRQVRYFVPLPADENVKNKIDVFFTVTSAAPRLAVVDSSEALPLDQVAVIGAGLMGRGIAQVCADSGLPVLLFDVDQQAAERAKKQIGDSLTPLVQKGRWPAARRKQLLGLMRPAADYQLLAGAQLVIESVFETLELKRQVLRNVQSANPEAVFATNTSALPIADIAAGAARPDRVVGMHYFSPVALMPLLEVVRGKHSSPAALATALDCGRRQKKTCIVVGDGPGFYTSRTFGAYVLTGFYLAEMGLDPWEVDRLAVKAGFPQGPLHVYGTAGGTVIHHAAGYLQACRPELFRLPETLTRMVEAGYVGAGKPCFYKDGLQPDDTARQYVSVDSARSTPSAEQAAEMLLLAMVNQAFLCLDEKVLQDYVTMDVGAVLGIGFPDCLHGPARYVGQNGVQRTRRRLQEFYETTGLPFFKPAAEFDRLTACGVDCNLI